MDRSREENKDYKRNQDKRDLKEKEKERRNSSMRVVQRILFVVLLSGLMIAQSPTSGSTSSTLETDVQKLLDAVNAQQKAMAEQQKQISAQQQEIEKLKQQLNTQAQAAPADSHSGQVVNTSLTVANPSPAMRTVSDMAQEDKPKESPLSFRIGAAEFTPGGFVDFENVFRSTNTGNVAATSFWAIPFSNTVGGHLTEYRSTGQYSRFNIKTHAKYGENDITGYVEFDFNGNDATNVFVTSNPHTDRLRVYWLDLKRGKWEFLGGQTWGLETPNRVGLSPNPADIFTTLGEDAQTHVGVNYTRAAEFRATYHFNDAFQWAVAAQNPDQFVGQGAEVVFPTAFNAQLGTQADAANQSTVPNLAPDLITKFAYDKSFGGRNFHFEAGGLMTTAKVTILPTVAGSTFTGHSTIGGGFNGGLNVELWKGSEGRNINFVGYGMWGYGVGRYLIGMAPQFVVAPVAITATTFNARTSGVHSGDLVTGFEFRPQRNSQFGVYYGGMYAQRNFFPDITSSAVTKPFIGFGGPNSSNVANRAIQEGSIDWTQTFWKNPQYGAVLLVTQASYLTRSPWFVAAGAPKNAHLGMGYVSLRYVLP
jgi:DNA-binding protein H-NS